MSVGLRAANYIHWLHDRYEDRKVISCKVIMQKNIASGLWFPVIGQQSFQIGPPAENSFQYQI